MTLPDIVTQPVLLALDLVGALLTVATIAVEAVANDPAIEEEK